MIMKGNEESFDETRISSESRKMSIGQMHQLRIVPSCTYAARTAIEGHRTSAIRVEYPGQRLPAKDWAFYQTEFGN
jgi:hypothetical protein